MFVSSQSWNESLQNYEEPVLSGTDLVDDNCNVTDCSEIENKWYELLSNWDSAQFNGNFLLKLLREGIPRRLRLSFWLKITAVDVNDTSFESFYDVCASKVIIIVHIFNLEIILSLKDFKIRKRSPF